MARDPFSARVMAKRPNLAPNKVAAREIGLPYTTLRALAQRGEIPVVKVGVRWYVDRGDVDRWIVEHTERLS
jgi:excisionase family DNA binding protein